jgi:patatin-like phospholipase/acyl hydrolase
VCNAVVCAPGKTVAYMTNWNIYLNKAIETKVKSERFLNESVRALMACKGFTQLSLFEACFVGGEETVISFNRECEMANLDIKIAAKMTKDEIIKCLSRNASDETKDRLRAEN